jgi:hypothetical protein
MARHNTQVQQRRGFGRTIYEAVCSCGWLSRPQPTEREAENEATDHVVAVTRGEP